MCMGIGEGISHVLGSCSEETNRRKWKRSQGEAGQFPIFAVIGNHQTPSLFAVMKIYELLK